MYGSALKSKLSISRLPVLGWLAERKR